jgi:hypothetical protein
MTATDSTSTSGTTATTQGDQLILYPDEKPGTGWLFFAATVLGLAGLMRLVDSLWAFRYHGALPDGLQNAIFGDNLKNYGWVWLGVGIVYILASVLIVARSQIGRWVGLVAAAVGALTAMSWMPYYPIWSLTYVAVAVMVLYALTRYGGRDPAPAR